MSTTENKAALITEDDLALVPQKALNKEQCQFILKPTPAQYIKQRQGKGGAMYNYPSGGYVQKVLNLMFGWDWDFDVLTDVDKGIVGGFVVLKCQLTVRTGTTTLTKTQFGRKEIAFLNEYTTNPQTQQKTKKKTTEFLDIGSDFKAAATDGMKKCAAMIGICADIYNKDEFREVEIEQAKEQFNNEHKTEPLINGETFEL